MSTPVKRPLSPKKMESSFEIFFGSILAISLLLAINFSGRIAAGRRIDSEREKLERTITALQVQATALQSELNFVNSDDFINQWARKEGKMVKGQEVLVVPVPGPSTPQPSPTPFVTAAEAQKPEAETWKLWWQLFFDSPVPSDSSGSGG